MGTSKKQPDAASFSSYQKRVSTLSTDNVILLVDQLPNSEYTSRLFGMSSGNTQSMADDRWASVAQLGSRCFGFQILEPSRLLVQLKLGRLAPLR